MLSYGSSCRSTKQDSEEACFRENGTLRSHWESKLKSLRLSAKLHCERVQVDLALELSSQVMGSTLTTTKNAVDSEWKLPAHGIL